MKIAPSGDHKNNFFVKTAFDTLRNYTFCKHGNSINEVLLTYFLYKRNIIKRGYFAKSSCNNALYILIQTGLNENYS